MDEENREQTGNDAAKVAAGAMTNSKNRNSKKKKQAPKSKRKKGIAILILILVSFSFLGAYIRTHFFQLYFQGVLGFSDAQEYADVTTEADTDQINAVVEEYYADSAHYNAAIQQAESLIQEYITETDQDNEDTFNNGYAGENHELGDAERDINSAEEFLGNGKLQKYVSSYIIEYATAAQLRSIEHGGEEAANVIVVLEQQLLGSALRLHSQWICTSDPMNSRTEERDTGLLDINGNPITETWYIYWNSYSILLYYGEDASAVDGVDWDTSTEDEDEDIIIDLIEGEENGETENVKEGLKSYHGSGIDGQSFIGNDTEVASASPKVVTHDAPIVGGLIDNIKAVLSSIYEYFVQELFTLKERGPVPKVTTLQYNSSAYAGSTYIGGNAALAAIEQYRNCQYQWGGTDPATGIDCSALIWLSYRDVGYTDIARTSANQRAQCIMVNQYWSYEEWNSIKQPGDLILFSGHVAMYVGTTEDMRNYGVSEAIIREEGLSDGVEYCLEASRENCDGPGDGVKFSTLQSNIRDWNFLGCGRPYDTATFSISGDMASLYQFFIAAGMSPEGASGLVGNLAVENGSFNPTLTSRAGYYGLAQWSPSRKANLMQYCQGEGLDYQSVSGQANFIVFEMRTRNSGLWEHLKHCPSASLAAQDICLIYEGAVTNNILAGLYQGDYSLGQKGVQRLQALGKRVQQAENAYTTLAH